MIYAPGPATGAVVRLLESLRAQGLEIRESDPVGVENGATLLLSTPVDWMKLGVRLAPWRVARGARIVVLSRVGAHPDAEAQGLRDLWRLEEYARVSLIPTLTLRLAPLVSSAGPFWTRLATGPRLREEARAVVMPVLEEDALAAIATALREERPAEGWFEVTGPEARSLGEWAEVASGGKAPARAAAAAEWEPALEELIEHRLSEPGIWQDRFGVRARAITAWAGAS